MPKELADPAELAGSDGSVVSFNVPGDDIVLLVMEHLRQEVIEEIEGINLSTPRGRWLMFKILGQAEDALPKTPQGPAGLLELHGRSPLGPPSQEGNR